MYHVKSKVTFRYIYVYQNCKSNEYIPITVIFEGQEYMYTVV